MPGCAGARLCLILLQEMKVNSPQQSLRDQTVDLLLHALMMLPQETALAEDNITYTASDDGSVSRKFLE